MKTTTGASTTTVTTTPPTTTTTLPTPTPEETEVTMTNDTHVHHSSSSTTAAADGGTVFFKNNTEGLVSSTSSWTEVATHFPKTLEETEKLEERLAREMESLSLADRDKILFDIHGFATHEEETIKDHEEESNVEALLSQMDDEIFKSRSKKEAYMEAKCINEAYVTDKAFRFMFLRSEGYDPKLAAERILLHFEVKREMFGSGDSLGRDIRLSDMSPDDMETIESGFFQIFPTRDVAGRTVMCFAPAHRKNKSVENVQRAMWYVSMAAVIGDEELQKKGFILVVYNDGVPPDGIREVNVVRRMLHTRLGLPKKLAACHFCGLDPSLRPFATGMRLFMGKELRDRLRIHYGSFDDIIFKLQTFGIKAEDHPIRQKGGLSLVWHHEWLQVRKSLEEASLAKDSIIVPRRFDVLFGRGKARDHTGNLRAAHLVDMYQEEYDKSFKFDKTAIAENIIRIIHESYGRFLKWEKNAWVEVDHDTARAKISHFFRQNRSKKKATPQDNNNTSTTTTTTADNESVSSASTKRDSPCPSPGPTMMEQQQQQQQQQGRDEKAAKRFRDPQPEILSDNE